MLPDLSSSLPQGHEKGIKKAMSSRLALQMALLRGDSLLLRCPLKPQDDVLVARCWLPMSCAHGPSCVNVAC